MPIARSAFASAGTTAVSPNSYTAVDALATFETSTDGTEVTNAILDSCWQGVNSTGWVTISDPSAQTAGATPEITIETDAASNQTQYLTVNGTPVDPSTGTRGIRTVNSNNRCIQLTVDPAGDVGIAFDFRWNGASQNSSPRDIVALRSDPTGNYQFLQGTDGATPNLHAHWQPYASGDGTGNDIDIEKGVWYRIYMQHVDGGNTFSVSIYTKATGVLLGTSTGAVSGSSTVGCTTIQIGCINYASGSGQSFDFDNIVINFNGPLPPLL